MVCNQQITWTEAFTYEETQKWILLLWNLLKKTTTVYDIYDKYYITIEEKIKECEEEWKKQETLAYESENLTHTKNILYRKKLYKLFEKMKTELFKLCINYGNDNFKKIWLEKLIVKKCMEINIKIK